MATSLAFWPSSYVKALIVVLKRKAFNITIPMAREGILIYA